MGPWLLHNFTRDRGNQFTLGTFSFALMVLRSVRTHSESEFIPHLSLTLSIALAFVSIGTLVFFVGHMAGRINVDTVIELVSREVKTSIRHLTSDHPQAAVPERTIWNGAEIARKPGQGYVQQLHGNRLADWAAENGTAIRLLVRSGDYVLPSGAIRDANALGA